MGLLLLTLASALLSTWSRVEAQRLFTIRAVSLTVEPHPDGTRDPVVTRDTNVTLRCQAVVSSSGPEALVRKYTIYKDGSDVYTKTSSSSEDLLYPLPAARVSNSGKYKCEVNIEGKSMASESRKLTVTGLSTPLLHLNKGVVTEGEELTARCTAPGETGSIFFYFYDDTKEIQEERVNSNQVEVRLRFSSAGIHRIHCAYTVLITPDSFKSQESNTVVVSVKELSISPVLEVSPTDQVFEGDRLDLLCTLRSFVHNTEKIQLYLSQGTQLLSTGSTRVNHSMVARASGPTLSFECRLEMGPLFKSATKTISVTELFSVPTLRVSPAEVFQREAMTLTCRSESVASERLDRKELVYTLSPPENPLVAVGTGVFSGKALQFDFNYTCAAEAKGIKKFSQTLTVRPKVLVSVPKISVYGKAVLGQPIQILCHSDAGSLPINYTLLWGYDEVDVRSVRLPFDKAIFTVSITKPEELSKYMCEARNSKKEVPPSKRLNATVIEPLTHPTLTVIPKPDEVSEGDHLVLICGVRGTPPVTFKWYRVGTIEPLNFTTTDNKHKDYQIPRVSNDDSGTYYCEAYNSANGMVRSEQVTIQVRMALWKKAVIGGVGLLVASLLVLGVCVLYFRSKRVRVSRAAVSVWSERKPEADDEDEEDDEGRSLSKEPDVEYTEVVHPRSADPARAPLRKGTDTVYSELQNAPQGAADLHHYGSVDYASLNGEQPEMGQYHPETGQYHPETGQYHPETGQFHPETGQFHPETGQYHPETGQYHPETGQYHPETGQYHPETGQYYPETGQYHHEMDQPHLEVHSPPDLPQPVD
ncbi:platelet endothelial cell adhesion molecule isoform X2 [Salarias fasciatus]|uniref:platelet endothelial cell adhesion molecule isoform X2 n=1 Tax=Salarias fasciatus TaxID=181472 RepID=UPI001176F453|nr:platelet endothelial cell adhesion molecule-like isoform X2 [Salarias fasciatus]